MSIFFVSDVHLGHDSPDKEAVKLRRLDEFFRMVASEGERLYILGDLFDFWFEYKHAIPKDHLAALFMLSELERSGIKITYITGNHDFWLGDMLSRSLSIDIHRDDVSAEHYGRRLLLIHGDGLAKSDRGYRALRRILRNRLNIFLYRQIPPDIGMPFARWCSRRSRLHTSQRPRESFLQEYRHFAETKLRDGYDIVVCAHTHFPEQQSFGSGVYVNTGDWTEHFTYAVMDERGIELKQWADR